MVSYCAEEKGTFCVPPSSLPHISSWSKLGKLGGDLTLQKGVPFFTIAKSEGGRVTTFLIMGVRWRGGRGEKGCTVCERGFFEVTCFFLTETIQRIFLDKCQIGRKEVDFSFRVLLECAIRVNSEVVLTPHHTHTIRRPSLKENMGNVETRGFEFLLPKEEGEGEKREKFQSSWRWSFLPSCRAAAVV